MPFLGYFVGKVFVSFIEQIDHYIAFIILGLIGINMIKESFDGSDESSLG